VRRPTSADWKVGATLSPTGSGHPRSQPRRKAFPDALPPGLHCRMSFGSGKLEIMNEFGIILIAIVGLVVIAGVICFVMEWIGMALGALSAVVPRRQPPEKPEEYVARLESPQFDVVEARLGAPVPETLKLLYHDTSRLRHTDFRCCSSDTARRQAGYFVYRFLPADLTTLDQIARRLGQHLFPFASDGSGRFYCVIIENDNAHTPCPVYWAEPNRRHAPISIADSLDEFLAPPRREESL
jgi:SMI1 / KNR4 family (SUKH-1)